MRPNSMYTGLGTANQAIPFRPDGVAAIDLPNDLLRQLAHRVRITDVAQRRAFHIVKLEPLNGPHTLVFCHAVLLSSWRTVPLSTWQQPLRLQSLCTLPPEFGMRSTDCGLKCDKELGEQGVGSSTLPAPTNFNQRLRELTRTSEGR